ncbi:hypothetical protein VTN31DRAFT_823 [Thermomyces dupontii]|uniref:uncharacterized protein n=1 Tax=Talaromyces thermophilus TaxID=28565 RepID=UPI0037438FD0
MAGLFKGSLAGPGYVILNILRVVNIVALLDVIAASVVMIVKIKLNNAFFFFESVSHVVTASVSIFLIFSELPMFQNFFSRFWPQLGPESGLMVLSLAMIVLGCSVLGYLNNEAYSEKALDTPFWRIIASAGLLSMTAGILNFFASFIFADSENNLTARQVRSYGAVADKVVERKSSHRSFQLGLNRGDTLPSYRSSTRTSFRNSKRFPLKISSPTSPVEMRTASEAHVMTPKLAHHPALKGEV